MKKSLVIFIAANVVLGLLVVGVLGGLLYLAETTPFEYGSALYGVQTTAEGWRLRLSRDDLRRAEFALELVDHRLADLARADDAESIAEAATAVSQALDVAIRSADATPLSEQEVLFARLAKLLEQAEGIVVALDPGRTGPDVTALGSRIAELRSAGTQEALVALVPQSPTLAAEIIPFLSKDVDHDLYPLEGAHVAVACESCHTEGKYKGTPRECSDCHKVAVNGLYPAHFDGACVDCHTVESWEPTQFNHVLVKECESCHMDDEPDEHYAPPTTSSSRLAALALQPSRSPQNPPSEDAHFDTCIRCHTDTTDWNNATFDHFGFKDCASCHEEGDTPDNHYAGQCSDCHDTVDWADAWFNHTGFPDCQSCHTPEGAHYPGQCSDCHTPFNWTTISYTHLAESDCALCHTQDTPSAHYVGACETCHNTEDWLDVDFDHTNYNDCVTCHTRSDHYAEQCSKCHNTENWSAVTFNHGGMSNCENCHTGAVPSDHYAGACADCHTTGSWTEVVLHEDGANCVDCHVDDAPYRHYRGSCGTCHNTERWDQISYNHAGARACVDCHADDAPTPSHYTAECAVCHTVQSWEEITFTHSSEMVCTDCHQDDMPAEHYTGECSACHTTDSWDFEHLVLNSCASCHTIERHWPGECSNCHTSTVDWLVYTFDHTGYTNCKACHVAPSGHTRGQCSKCHTTDNWTPFATADVPEAARQSAGAAPPRPGSGTELPAPPPPVLGPIFGPSR